MMFTGKQENNESTGSLLINRTFVGGASALPYAHNLDAVNLKAHIMGCVKAHMGVEPDLDFTSTASNRI